jgi:hypothetical protein
LGEFNKELSMQKILMIATALVGLSVPLVTASDAEAKKPRKATSDTVTACSRYGSDCYTARVVRSRVGPKLVLRGGTVIDCIGDCRDTLREKTVDFWETQGMIGG